MPSSTTPRRPLPAPPAGEADRCSRRAHSGLLRRGRGCYRLEIEAPFDPYPTADLVADVNQMNRMVEQQLGCFPEQYMWFQDLRKPRSTIRARTVSTRRGSAASARAATGTLIDTAPCGRF